MNNQRGTRKAGDLDTSFGDEGWINLNHIFGFSAIDTTQVSPDGGLVVLSHNSHVIGYHISKFLPNGTLDRTFGTEGVKQDVHPMAGRPRVAMELLGDKIQVFAAVEGSLMLARYNTNGQPDEAFGPEGKVFIALGDVLSNGAGTDVVSFAACAEPVLMEKPGTHIPPYSGRGIVAAGFGNRWFVAFPALFTDAPVELSVLLCLTRDGSVDLSFNGVGYAVIDLAGEAQNSNRPYQLHVQTNEADRGKPVLAVSTAAKIMLVRRLATGQPDYSFGPEGTSYLPLNANEINLLPNVIAGGDDALKIVGWSDMTGQHLASGRAYDAQGKLDTRFNNGELWLTPSIPADTSSRWSSGVATGAGADYRLVVSGTNNGLAEMRVSRVNGAAQPDLAFGEGGISRFPSRLGNAYLLGFQPGTVVSQEGDYYVSYQDRIFKVLGH